MRSAGQQRENKCNDVVKYNNVSEVTVVKM
jgi:hypothetical protein